MRNILYVFIVLLSFLGSDCWAQIESEKHVEANGFVWYELKAKMGIRRKGVKSTSGETIVPIGDYYTILYDSNAQIFIPHLWGTLDHGVFTQDGKCIIPFDRHYQLISWQKEGGFYKVMRNNLYGACDVTGKEIIPLKYGPFLQYSQENGFHDLLISNDGNPAQWLILGVKLDGKGRAYSFNPSTQSNNMASSSKAQVKKTHKVESDGFVWYELENGTQHGAESASGKTLVPMGEYRIDYYSWYGGRFQLEDRNGYEAIYTKDGTCLIPLSRKYDYISPYISNSRILYYSVIKNKLLGTCDAYGTEAVPPRYDAIQYHNERGFEYKSSNGRYVALGIKLDGQGRAYQGGVVSSTSSSSNIVSSSGTSSSQFVDFEYLAYTSYRNGSVVNSFNKSDNMAQYVIRFDLNSSPGNIILKLITIDKRNGNKIETLESYTINPSQSEFLDRGKVIGIDFYKNGQRKIINIGEIKGVNKCVFIGDVSNQGTIQSAKGFMPLSEYEFLMSSQVAMLEGVIDGYNKGKAGNNQIYTEPSNFDTKFSQLKTSLSKFKW